MALFLLWHILRCNNIVTIPDSPFLPGGAAAQRGISCHLQLLLAAATVVMDDAKGSRGYCSLLLLHLARCWDHQASAASAAAAADGLHLPRILLLSTDPVAAAASGQVAAPACAPPATAAAVHCSMFCLNLTDAA